MQWCTHMHTCKHTVLVKNVTDLGHNKSVTLVFEYWKYRSDSKLLRRAGINTPKKDNTPLLQCTHHMCPIRVHWHVKLNYKDYWRVKVAVTNFNYRLNYSQWTLVAQHPNLNNVTQVFSFDYKPLVAYESISECLQIQCLLSHWCWCSRN